MQSGARCSLLVAALMLAAPFEAEAARLGVRVFLPDGARSGAGVEVSVRSQDGSYDRQAETDARGRAEFRDVPVGPVTVIVSWQGAVAREEVELRRKKQNVKVTLPMTAAPPGPPPKAEPPPSPEPSSEAPPPPAPPQSPSKPDLVLALEIAFVSDRSVGWRWRLTNQGNAPADLTGADMAAGLSSRPTWPPEVRKVYWSLASSGPTLEPGQTISSQFALTWDPGTVVPGTYYFVAKADEFGDEGRIDELDESNNVASASVDVPAPLADLVVEITAASASSKEVVISYRVHNRGAGEADLTGAGLQFGAENAPAPARYPFGLDLGATHGPALPAGQSLTGQHRFARPSSLDPAQPWTAVAWVDRRSAVEEVDEGNNTTRLPVAAIVPPAPAIVSVTATPDGYHIRGRNFGLEPGAVVVHENGSALASGAIASLSPTDIYVRSTRSGAYEVSVEVAGVRSEAVSYGDTGAGKPPPPGGPVVSTVEPASGTYTIRGSGFGRNALVVKVFENDAPVGAQNILILLDDRIVVRSGVPAGTRIRVRVGERDSNVVALGSSSEAVPVARPEIEDVIGTRSGYLIIGRNFGSDPASVTVFENQKPLDASTLRSVAPTAIEVASRASSEVNLRVRVARDGTSFDSAIHLFTPLPPQRSLTLSLGPQGDGALVCVGTYDSVGAFGVKVADANGQAVFRDLPALPATPQMLVSTYKDGFRQFKQLVSLDRTDNRYVFPLQEGFSGNPLRIESGRCVVEPLQVVAETPLIKPETTSGGRIDCTPGEYRNYPRVAHDVLIAIAKDRGYAFSAKTVMGAPFCEIRADGTIAIPFVNDQNPRQICDFSFFGDKHLAQGWGLLDFDYGDNNVVGLVPNPMFVTLVEPPVEKHTDASFVLRIDWRFHVPWVITRSAGFPDPDTVTSADGFGAATAGFSMDFTLANCIGEKDWMQALEVD